MIKVNWIEKETDNIIESKEFKNEQAVVNCYKKGFAVGEQYALKVILENGDTMNLLSFMRMHGYFNNNPLVIGVEGRN